MPDKPIYVTQPSLANFKDYSDLLKGVWERGILTHNGPLVQQLEVELAEKLNCQNLSLVVNGTVAIQIAIKALGLKGKIITTPFTWVATISAIKWEGCEPIFCDIEEDTLNMDPMKLESLITDDTVAIMPVHVFGTACNVEEIQNIADKYGLKVIYDAAHAIGTKVSGKCIMEYGDISASSLHATKLFNTGEGGICVTTDEHLKEKINRIRFFGHDLNKDIVEDGFNGKMTEIHAALGLANLRGFDGVLQDRKVKYDYYKSQFSTLNNVTFQKISNNESNYSYFPIIFKSEKTLKDVEKELIENNFYPRRYFYPSVNTLENIVSYVEMPISESVSSRILCLPLYYGLEMSEMQLIASIIRNKLSQ